MTRCLSCRANVTNLALIPKVQEHSRTNRIQTVWEMSTYGATLEFLRRQNVTVYTSEYFPDKNSGEVINGVVNQDVQITSFPDDHFDLITSNQVFEHVVDDVKGYKECFRILKRKGALIFSVPLFDIPATQQLACVAEGKVVHMAPPEYHSSRVTGSNSVLTYWRHSIHDIRERVSSAGFEVSLVNFTIEGSDIEPAQALYAVKN
jgi:SAM-dependent methyltransferase